MRHDKELAPQRRSRSLAELDARIAQAEAVYERRRAGVRARMADPKWAHAAAVAAQSAEERLAMLRQSRAALLEAEPAG